MSTQTLREVYLVDGARTPFIKARSKPGSLSASDLAVNAGRELLARQPFPASALGEVVLGCMMPSEIEANIARLVALRLGCGDAVPGVSVQRNCASGMQAIDTAMNDIRMGRHDLVLAGGTEAMSRAPLLYNADYVNWLADFYSAKTISLKLKQVLRLRPHFLVPVIALIKGLSDPLCNLSMGQTAEKIAYHFGISREAMDTFAYDSHQRVIAAQDAGRFTEVSTAYDYQGGFYSADDGVRRDTTIAKLGELKPFFDKKFGSVTAGNSSQVTDGAALVLLASKEAVQRYQLPVLAKIVDTQWAGLDPSEMGLGPVYSATALLKRLNMQKKDIDLWEINEAFAAQVLGCLAAWEDQTFCQRELGLDQAFGKIDPARLNVDGGAIALGHPVGASGARIVLRLAHIMKREKARTGLASICIGGGQGGAMLLENVDGVSA